MTNAAITASQKKWSMWKSSPTPSLIHSVICNMKALTMNVNRPKRQHDRGEGQERRDRLDDGVHHAKDHGDEHDCDKPSRERLGVSPNSTPLTTRAATQSATALMPTLISVFCMTTS
jgi:hypothetical protein